MDKSRIPNALTFLRVAIVPLALLVATVHPGAHSILFWLFAVAALTDFFDGYLARRWNAVSPLGTLLDPIADKLLVAVVLLYLQKYTTAPLAAIGLILCRELYIAGLREFLAQRQIKLPVSRSGKWKTALQLIAIALMLAAISFPMPFVLIHQKYLISAWNFGVMLLWVSAILALVSAVDYTRKALPSLRA